MDIDIEEIHSDVEDLPELEPLCLEESFSFTNFLQAATPLSGPDLADTGADSMSLFGSALPEEGYQDELELQTPSQNDAAGTNQLRMDEVDWSIAVTNCFERYKLPDPSLRLPWEMPSMQGLLGQGQQLSLPRIHGIPLSETVPEDPPSSAMVLGGEVSECGDAAYLHAVSNVQDLDYMDNKQLQLQLACSKWLDILSVDWQASAVGVQVCLDLRSDPTGKAADETIRSSFGIKSHSTSLKRAGALKRYILWHRNQFGAENEAFPVFPLREPDVWEFFKTLKEARIAGGRGYTAPAAFLETVRFCKFTVDLRGADEVLCSRRLQGFAALEKREKGPTRQAPPMELEHLQRLHSILQSNANPVDRIGAGCFLVCTYARARWSDLRYIHHVEVESKRNGCLVLFTREHKTSSIGERREQYLPLLVPWEGVTSDNWLHTFLGLYEQVGLDIQRVPLGPLLSLPRSGGGFVHDLSRRLRLHVG